MCAPSPYKRRDFFVGHFPFAKYFRAELESGIIGCLYKRRVTFSWRVGSTWDGRVQRGCIWARRSPFHPIV